MSLGTGSSGPLPEPPGAYSEEDPRDSHDRRRSIRVTRSLRTNAGRQLHAQVSGNGPTMFDEEPELTAEYVTMLLLSLILMVRRRFAAGTDPREITVFVQGIAQVEPMLRRREAEA